MKRVVFVLKGYPRLSESFIAQEIHALEKLGLQIHIFSLRKPRERISHAFQKDIGAIISYLPEYLHNEPLRVFRSWKGVRSLPGYKPARKLWLDDLKRDPTRNRIRRFGQALILVHELPEKIEQLHAHFLHTPASVAYYAAKILQIPFSVSAHAKDIWTIPDWEKREKLLACSWAVTCTATNYQHLKSKMPNNRLHLVYHGLDFNRFPKSGASLSLNTGSDPHSPIVILSIGRLVEKKGYRMLLEALAKLPNKLHWRLEHAGNGLLSKELKELARNLNIADRVHWNGALTHEHILKLYQQADLFVLASQIATSGDRDGLPNVLMEAQSQALPCISTRLPSIEELIKPFETGILVKPGSALDLSDAIRNMIQHPAERLRLGRAGEKRVRNHFSMESNIKKLTKLFDLYN